MPTVYHVNEQNLVAKKRIKTEKLDVALRNAGFADRNVGLLKLDVQGAELLVLKGAPETLSRTAVVYTEVEFAPLYKNQPLFHDIDALLRASGFELIDFPLLKRYRQSNSSGHISEDRLLWGDALYFNARTEDSQKLSQAIVGALMGKYTISQSILDSLRQNPAVPRPGN